MPTPNRRTAAYTAGYVVLATVDATLAGRRGTAAHRLRYLTKPALMPLLATATREAHGNSTALTAAQALSWGGDVALLGSGTARSRPGWGRSSGHTWPTSPGSRCAVTGSRRPRAPG